MDKGAEGGGGLTLLNTGPDRSAGPGLVPPLCQTVCVCLARGHSPVSIVWTGGGCYLR